MIRPTAKEVEFLDLAVNRFLDLFDEVINSAFFSNDDIYRFSRIKEGFAIYTELLTYEPLGWYIKHLKSKRSPMEAEIAGELFKVVRNIIVHFPFYDRWNDVWIRKSLVNWQKDRQSIDRFFQGFRDAGQVKYRFWESDVKRMTYVIVDFPTSYDSNEKIYLRDILPEKPGVRFSFFMMKSVIDSQIEAITVNEA